MMATMAVFVKGHRDIEMEFETAEEALRLAYDRAWGLSIADALAMLRQNGAFVSESICASPKMRKALLAAGMDAGALLSGRGNAKSAYAETAYVAIFEHLDEAIEDNREEIEREMDGELLDRALAFLAREHRAKKLDGLI